MRFEGTLTSWDDGKGIGLIEPHQGGEALPVREYDMRHFTRRPMLGEVWTFEVRLDPAGQKRAVNARRLEDVREAASAQQRATQDGVVRPPAVRAPSVWPLRLTVASVLGLLLIAAWTHVRKLPAPVPLPAVPDAVVVAPATAPEVEPVSAFRCDGRTQCAQMTSCEEATQFLKNCPGVQMDGNADGVPCERQWCTGR